MLITWFCLVACQSNDLTTTTVSTTPTPGSSDHSKPTPKLSLASTASSSLPDLSQGLSREGCDNGPGEAGAASYFVGELRISPQGTVQGSEEWLMFANSKWKARNGADCKVVWSLQGTTTPPTACAGCGLGVTLTNYMDLGSSTCPEDMAKGETGKQIRYDLDLRKDGTAVVYFSRSGKRVGEGYHEDNTVRFVTDMSCRWF